MDKDFLIKLTLALYRVTEVFPASEPLRFSIRENSLQVLADSLLFFAKNPLNLKEQQKSKFSEQILENVEVLEALFEVAQKQRWLKEENFFALKREYDKIKQAIKNNPKEQKLTEGLPEKKSSSPAFLKSLMNSRCKKILSVLKEKEMAQVHHFKEIFPDVTKRTLRRDLDYLLSQGLVERMGDKNHTFYKLRRKIS